MTASRKQHGLTLIELSLVLVILGLVTSIMVPLVPALTRLASTEAAIESLTQTNNALTGFTLTAGRLPCADTDMDGVENCPAVAGGFPYLTLGLAAPLRNAQGYDYRYAVYSRSDGLPMNDASLTGLQERWQPAIASGLNSALTVNPTSLGGDSNHLDACQALGIAESAAADENYTHLVHNGAREHVAYVLVDPGQGDRDGDGSIFDGLNTNGIAFEHPTKGVSRTYDDVVRVVYFNQLWEDLGCSALLSTAGHAHPNIESFLAMFRQTIRDYRAQLKLVEEMAFADNFQAGASLASAAAGLATAAAEGPTATASALNTAGATGAAVPASIAAIGLNTTAVGAATAEQIATALNHQTVLDHLDELDDLIDELDDLYDSVQSNVRNADHDALSAQ